MNCVRALCGVTVSPSRSVRFGIEDCKASAAAMTTESVTINEKDFRVVYDGQANKWIVLCRGSRTETRVHRGYRTVSRSTRYLMWLDKSMKMSCVSGYRTAGWYRTMREFTDQ